MKFSRHLKSGFFFFASWWIIGGIADRAEAQGFLRSSTPSQSGRFIEPPRAIAQQLRDSERSIDEGRYSDAVLRLGEMLQRDGGNAEEDEGGEQDYFLDLDASGEPQRLVKESLLRRARRLIGKLPPQGLETYELRYGALARKMLNDAAEGRDWNAVETVRRKYFHTQGGYEASMLLAQREWFGGRPLATYLLLEELVQCDPARAYLGSSLDVLFAAAARLSDRDVSEFDIEPGDSIVLAGKKVDVPSADEINNWLDTKFRVNSVDFAPTDSDYRLFGGEVNRNGGDLGEMPLANPRWRVETTASPRQEKSLKQRTDEMSTRGDLPPPSTVPLKVGDQLLMRTTERLVGVDYRTGKRVWQYPWQSTYEGFDDDEASFDMLPGEESGVDLLSQRVWNDLPFGQMSSDGERVFVLDDLGKVEPMTFNPIIGMQGSRPADRGRNTLVALDLKTEGKLLWQVGAGEEQATSLTDAFFLGPPLPLDGRLYVMIEVAGDICLSCLEPRTGEELWRQQLVAIETGGIDLDPIRRVAGAMPTFHRGVLLCPTGAGAVVAVDLVDRMLRWGRSYDRNTELTHSLMNGNGLDQNQLMQRWFDGAAIIVDDTVVITPIESDRLFVLDLFSGDERFAEKPRVRMRYVAGIRDNRILVAGSDHVRALDLQSGNTLWTTPADWLSAGQQVSGIGLFGTDDYLVPTTSNQLIRISLADGSVLERRTTAYPLGNLVASGGEIISQSSTMLSVAFGEKSLAPVVDEMLAEDPNDFEALVRKADLLIQNGSREEALEYLARARAIDPDSDDVYLLSVSAMLGSLRESPQLDGPLVELLEKLIDRPSQRIELLALRVQAGMTAGEPVGTARMLVEMSQLLRRENFVEGSDFGAINDPARQCTVDCWIEARMHAVYAIANESQRVQIDALVAETVAPLVQSSSNVLQRIMRHFGIAQSISDLRAVYGRRMISESSLLKAERSALGNLPWNETTLQSLSNDQLRILVEASLDGAMTENAGAALAAIDFEKLIETAPEQAAQWTQMLPTISSVDKYDWPKTASLTWDSPQSAARMMSSFGQRAGQTTVTGGPTLEGWNLVSEFQNPVAFRDPTGQLRGIPVDGLNRRDEGDKDAVINAGVSVVVTPSELICIDMYELLKGSGESILWRRDWGGDGGGSALRRSETTLFDDQVYRYKMNSPVAQSMIAEFRVGPILGDRVMMLKGGELVALDLFTSEPLWRNSDAPRSGVVLSDGREVLVVSSQSKEIVAFDALDGAKLRTTEWEHGSIWTAQNRYVLSYTPANDKRLSTVRLVDVFDDNRVVEELTTAISSRGVDGIEASFGRVIDGRYMVMLGTDGKLTLWDVREGRSIGQSELPAMDQLQGMHALTLTGQVIVLPRLKPDETPMSLGRDRVTSGGQNHQTIHSVHAISLEDAGIRWSFEGEDSWGCTLTQPVATPALILSRSLSIHNTTGARKRTLDVVALDVRDGSVLNERLGKQVHSQTNEIETRLTVQPASERLLVQIGGELLTYLFGDVETENKEADDDAEPDELNQ